MSKLAFVFPGQGSQTVGMLFFAPDNAAVRQTLEEADAALGFALSEVIAQGPAEVLSQTVNTQPAMLTGSVALYRAYLASGRAAPEFVAGHSLGEYSALVAAGVLDFADAVRAVRFRAQAMQRAVPQGVGAMAAVMGLDAAEIVRICSTVSTPKAPCEAVNFNEPRQTVIAGAKSAVDAACEALRAAGAKRALLLPVSAPFHSRLMAPAALELRDYLAQLEFKAPQLKLINNIDVEIALSAEAIRDALYRQAFGPVRWVETVQALRAQGVSRVIECGPGKVLSGLVKRIDAELEVASISDLASLEAA